MVYGRPCTRCERATQLRRRGKLRRQSQATHHQGDIQAFEGQGRMEQNVPAPREIFPHTDTAHDLTSLETEKVHETKHHAHPDSHDRRNMPTGKGSHDGRGRKREQSTAHRERRGHMHEAHEEHAVKARKRSEAQRQNQSEERAAPRSQADAAVQTEIYGGSDLQENLEGHLRDHDRGDADQGDGRQMRTRIQAEHALHRIGRSHSSPRRSSLCGHVSSTGARR